LLPIEITTVAERPGLGGSEFNAGPWPEFMRHNRISDAYFFQSLKAFPAICLIATSADGAVVADAHAVAFALGGAGRSKLPAGGWEQAVIWAFHDADRGVAPNTACALNISVAASCQEQGLSGLMLEELRRAVGAFGLSTLIAPVRPIWKHREPATSMTEYAARVRTDGLPYDPWLRTHVRAGGQIIGVAPTSWVIAGSLTEWRSWTGLSFDRDGAIDVPSALVPVHCNTRADHAIYVEPNVWIRHTLDHTS